MRRGPSGRAPHKAPAEHLTKIFQEAELVGRVQRGGSLAVGGVGADQADERDRPRLGEQPGDVRGAADVLATRGLVEAEVAVEAVAQVVAVEQEGRLAGFDQALLDGGGDRRLAGARQAGEPQRRAARARASCQRRSRVMREPCQRTLGLRSVFGSAASGASTSVSRITPAATVSLVASSITIRLPVTRLRR